MKIELRGATTLLHVFDMPTSLKFYRDLLGFEVVEHSGDERGVEYSGWAWLRLGGADVMLNSQYDEGEQPPARDEVRAKAHLDTCLYLDAPDPEGIYAYLKDRVKGIEPPSIAPYGMRQLYVRDPDGFHLCFQCQAEGEDDHV